MLLLDSQHLWCATVRKTQIWVETDEGKSGVVLLDLFEMLAGLQACNPNFLAASGLSLNFGNLSFERCLFLEISLLGDLPF